MTNKLHINLSQGVIDIEGDADLVREIYGDFKDQLMSGVTALQERAASQPQGHEVQGVTSSKPRPKAKSTRFKSNKGADTGGISSDNPKLDKNLDTSKLREYFDTYVTTKHPERILIFLKFMTDELGIESPNSDQIYTCYKALGIKVPQAFAKAIRDTSKAGYIDLKSSTEMPITIAGDNYFEFDLKKAAE